MRTKYRSREEQLQLVIQCRTSGLSDCKWCRQHGIPKTTVYDMAKRLQKAGYQVPESKWTYSRLPEKQELVKIELLSKEVESSTITEENTTLATNQVVTESNSLPAVEIHMAGTTVSFFNNTSPEILKYTLELLGGVAHHAW